MVSHQFKLVLEGIAAGSPDHERKVKGALLADFGLSVPEAQQVLSTLPFILISADDESDLRPWHALLHNAGAQVAIVRPKILDPAAPLTPDLDFALQSVEGASNRIEPAKTTAIIESGLDFFLDEHGALPSAPAAPPSAAAPPPENEIEFSLELQPPVETAALKESVVEESVLVDAPAPAAAPAPPPPEEEFVIRAIEPEPPTAPPEPSPRDPVETAKAPPAELPHNVPIGRRLAAQRATSAPPAPHRREIRRETHTASFIGGFSRTEAAAVLGGILLLGIANWIIYNL